MKTLQYKIFLLIFITSTTLVAQKVNVYTKSFETNKNTTALLKLRGGAVKIKSSPDENFYIEYNYEFKNYSKRKREKLLKKFRKKIKLEVSIKNNHITLLKDSDYPDSFYYNHFNFINRNKNDTYKEKKLKHKLKKMFLEEIKQKSNMSQYAVFINSTNFSEERKKELIYNITNTKKRVYIKTFVIRIPKNLNTTIDAKNTNVRIYDDLKNELSIRINRGRFIAKSLNNNRNVIKVKDAVFIVEDVNGGDLTLNNVRKGLIGSLNEVKLSADFSNLEIGEIQKDNIFKGFSNEILMHNFFDNFSQFNLFSEYSKIHYFKLKKDYTLNVFGYNTVVNIGNSVKKSSFSKNEKKSKFFKIESTGKGVFSGMMNFDITHSFIYIH